MPVQSWRADNATDSCAWALRIATLLVACAAIACAACGSSPTVIVGSSDTNGGVIVVSQAGSYSYRDTVCDQNVLRLRSDSGQTDYMKDRSGTLYLSVGNWSVTPGVIAEAFEPSPGCTWTVTLTSTS